MTKNKKITKKVISGIKSSGRAFPQWNDYVLDKMKEDSEFVNQSVRFALRDFIETGDDDFLSVTLKQAAAAKGITKLAKETGLSRQYIYEMLSEKGNPTLSTFRAVLAALGFKMYIRAIKPTKKTT